MAPSKSAKSQVVGGRRRVATRKPPSTKTTPTRDIASEVNEYLSAVAHEVIENNPQGSITYPDPPGINLDQYKPAWGDDAKRLMMESPPVWDWIIDKSRQMRRSLDSAEDTLSRQEEHFREAAMEKMKNDGASTADLDSLPEYAPYHEAIEKHCRAALQVEALRLQSVDTHKVISDALLESMTAVRSFLHDRPDKDETEGAWLEALKATLILQDSSNDFHEGLSSKTRSPLHGKRDEKIDEHLFDKWCAMVRASRHLEESQSQVRDAIQAGKSWINPNTPWSRYATNSKLYELSDLSRRSITEPLPENVDPETGLPTGGGTRWRFSLLDTEDEEGNPGIQARATHYEFRNSFSGLSLKDIPHAPWVNRTIQSYNNPRLYDLTVSRPGKLRLHAEQRGSLLDQVASALTSFEREWSDSLEDVRQDLRENHIVPLGRETTLKKARGAMEALGHEERDLNLAHATVISILAETWKEHENQTRGDVTEDIEKLREALSDESELTQNLGQEWAKIATKVVNNQMLNGREKVFERLEMLSKNGQGKEQLKASREELQASSRLRKRDLTRDRRKLSKFFEKHGYPKSLPNSVDELVSTLTAPEVEPSSEVLDEGVSSSEGMTTKMNTPSSSAWTEKMPPDSFFGEASRVPSPGLNPRDGNLLAMGGSTAGTPRSTASRYNEAVPQLLLEAAPPSSPQTVIEGSSTSVGSPEWFDAPEFPPEAMTYPPVLLPPVEEPSLPARQEATPLQLAGHSSTKVPSPSAPPKIAGKSVESESVTSKSVSEPDDEAPLRRDTEHNSPAFRPVSWAEDDSRAGSVVSAGDGEYGGGHDVARLTQGENPPESEIERLGESAPSTPTLMSAHISSQPPTRLSSPSPSTHSTVLSTGPSAYPAEPDQQLQPEPEPAEPEPFTYDHDLHNSAISIGNLHRRWAPVRRKSDSIMERRPAGWEFVPETDYDA